MKNKSEKKVYQGEIFTVWQWEQQMYDGTTQLFERATRCDTARMIGVLPDKRILLVWDEQPDREGVLGAAGGQVEEGEPAQTAAEREFFEETGYKVGKSELLFAYPSMGRVEYMIHFFVGKQLIKVSEPEADHAEKITLRFFTFDEFLALGRDEQLRDLRLRIMLLEAQLDNTKKQELYTLLYE